MITKGSRNQNLNVKNPVILEIAGHTDFQGESYKFDNQKLSLQRAESAKNRYLSQVIDEYKDVVKAIGYGSKMCNRDDFQPKHDLPKGYVAKCRKIELSIH
ncbi:MAG: hypothetical protein OFPI_44970 [Osedax symbiont Rs2]|nr:MAG: hypothetical protein OFPI_44970 [Osedax symbiont Rs2]EPJ45020.1 MAG: hypothetical protein OFPII_30530 [Osedax symbiont Rs1]